MNLFKFTSFESGLKIIDTNSVLLKNPYEYNDPFDCSLVITEEAINKCIELSLNYYLFKEFIGIVFNKRIKIPLLLKPVFAWIKWQTKIIKKLMKKNPSYERMLFFDNFVKYGIKKMNEKDPNYIKKLNIEKVKFAKKIKTTAKEIQDNLLVSCFSKKNDSILMWSHYADSHKGLCIEFSENNDKQFKDVIYSKKRELFSIERITAVILGYDFLGENVGANNKKLIDSVGKTLLTKSKIWKYEDEVRTIHSYSIPDEINFDGDKPLFKMNKIKAVYIGCKASKDDISRLLSRKINFEVYQSIQSSTSFEVEYKRIV